MVAQGQNIRVLVVDDSAVYRTFIGNSLNQKPGIEVIGTAYDAMDAQEKIARLKPDVLSLDVEMPQMNGIELTKVLLKTMPLPIILVSAANVGVFDALQAGAVDFVRKPDPNSNLSPEIFIDELAGKIRIASVAKIAKKISPAATKPAATGQSTAGSGASGGAQAGTMPAASMVKTTTPVTGAIQAASLQATNLNSSAPGQSAASASVSAILAGIPKSVPASVQKKVLIVLGASTGGTESTFEVLKRLPADIPPMLIVQHMPPGFTKLYAERLNKNCAMKVKEAEDGDVVVPGQVYIAPGDRQMALTRTGNMYQLRCGGTEKVSGHCPSVDYMFKSVAANSQLINVGIILTGMGRDGAEGLMQLKKQGAHTFGESPDSCVVYGMPMAAFNIGAVSVQASNKDIPALLMKHLNDLAKQL